MRTRTARTGAALALLLVSSCTKQPAGPPPDISGRWTLTFDPDLRGNRSVVDCDVKQQGDEFTIQCGAADQVMKGKVTGSSVTRSFTGPGVHPRPRDPITLTNTATLAAVGSSMKGTWRLTSSLVNEKGNFAATKKP